MGVDAVVGLQRNYVHKTGLAFDPLDRIFVAGVVFFGIAQRPIGHKRPADGIAIIAQNQRGHCEEDQAAACRGQDALAPGAGFAGSAAVR